MDSSSNTDNNKVTNESAAKTHNQHYNHPRGKPQRSYNDLREVLNHKRQFQNEQTRHSGPPTEPRYNFLSDPLRDNDYDSKNRRDKKPSNFGSGRFPRQNYDQNRGGGRGRGINNYGRNQYGRPGDEWKEDKTKYDQEKLPRQKSSDGGWSREWDAGKESVWDESSSSNRSKMNPQHRPSYSRFEHHQNRKFDSPRSFEYPKHDGRFQYNDTSGSNTSSYFRSSPKRGNHYNRSPQNYNPNYKGQKYNKRNSQVTDLCNIQVEYSVDSGTRKCTIDKTKINSDKKYGNDNNNRENLVIQCEENWDDDDDNKNNETEQTDVKNITNNSETEEETGTSTNVKQEEIEANNDNQDENEANNIDNQEDNSTNSIENRDSNKDDENQKKDEKTKSDK